MALGFKAVTVTAVLAVFHLAPEVTRARSRVETHGDQSPGVIAGGDVSIAYGYTPAQLRDLIDLVNRSASDAEAARRDLGEVQRRLGVTEGAALAMLRALGRGNVPVEQLPQALADLAERHKELLDRLRSPDAPDPEVARMKEQARDAIERGDYAEADRLLRGAEEDLAAARRKREAPDEWLERAAETRAERARLAELGSCYVEAARLFREAADLVPEADPVRRAKYLNGAGRALRRGGKHREAEPLLRRALALRERALGPAHPDVAASADNLALVLRELGRLAEAEPLLRRALTIRERALGPTSPEVAVSAENLAVTLRDLGRPGRAEPLLRRALALRERALGPDRPAVAGTVNNLASVLRNLGRPTQAEPLHRRAIAIYERALGPDHPDVAQPLVSLAVTLRALGRPSEAEPLLRRALAIRERALGPDHRLTRRVRELLPTSSSKLDVAARPTTVTAKPTTSPPTTERASAGTP